MADMQPLPDVCSLKNSEILVHVEEAVLDFIVVSYEYDNRLYQGVLLDASKRALPCGVFAPPGFPDVDTAQLGLGTDEDKMHSVVQRYSYFQGTSPSHLSPVSKDAFPPGSAYHMRRTMRGGQSKFKNSRMTVRLRPRQVLCSKCKSICNENSENVDLSKKRKGEESSAPTNEPIEKRTCASRQISPKSPRPPFSENPPDNKPSSILQSGRRKNSATPALETTSIHRSLIPRNVKEADVSSSISRDAIKLKLVEGYWSGHPNETSRGNTTSPNKSSEVINTSTMLESGNSFHVSSIQNYSPEVLETERSEREDVLDASVVEVDVVNVSNENISQAFSAQPDTSSGMSSTFGSSETDESQDRMVLRKKRNVGSMEDLWDESVFLEDTMRRTPVIKISFGSQGEGTVLKIPAKVRSYHESGSDHDDQSSSSPKSPEKDVKAKAARRALKKAKKEARRKEGDGAASLSELLDGDTPAADTTSFQRKRKRKVKHKRKHKGVRADHEISPVKDGLDIEVPLLMEEDPLKIDGSMSNNELAQNSSHDYDSMKEKCLNQKLSISLKRLNTIVYSQLGEDKSSAGSDSLGSNSELSGADDLPDFPRPPSDHELMTVGSCLTGDGRTMEVGDVVWGKVHGFPWWPGKVLSITIHRRDDGGAGDPQAHVAWYGSSTSSLMPCDQLSPFLETFKTRYNKKKRGPYKEAIRQATSEAQRDCDESLQEIDVVA